jgi:hypothetical protein
MTKQDIYTVGGTVQAGNGLYLPRRADEELLELCRTGEFAYVLTPRQLGKSSLVVSTAKRLAEEQVRCVIIDLSGIGVELACEAWYLGLLVDIEERLRLETNVIKWWHAHSHLGVTQRLTEFFEKVVLSEVHERVVIFVDEIDTTLSLDFTDDFYAAIRYLYNSRATIAAFKRLSFVLIGVAAPGDLIRDVRRTPFNIGRRVDLADFTFAEASPLTAGLGLPDEDAQSALRWILKWTNGHPYLTQRLCKALADEHQPGWTAEEIEGLVAKTFFSAVSEQDNNLQFVRDMLTERAPNRADVLATYRKIRIGKERVVDEEQSLVKNHLKLSGVVCREKIEQHPSEQVREKISEQGVLHVRNRIYSEAFDEAWVKEHMPANWFALARRSGVLIVAVLLAVSVGILLWARHNSKTELTKAQEAANSARQQAANDVAKATAERDAALLYRNEVEQNGGISSSDYLEYQKHYNPDGSIEKPARTKTLNDIIARGSLILDFFSDESVRVTRISSRSNLSQIHAWIPAPPTQFQPPPTGLESAPGKITGAMESLPEAQTPNAPPLNSQYRFASYTAPGPLPGTAVGNCLNPHPGPFRSWYGEKNGCWVAVYRQWPDGCTHYQWFNGCNGIWDTYPNGAPKVYWTNCVH